MNEENREAAATALRKAEETRVAIAPLTDSYPDFDVVDAYEVQRINIEQRLAEGRLIRGHKVGLSSRAMQEMLGVNEPDYGHLLDDMFVLEGSQLSIGDLVQPRIEPEVAFVLNRPLAGPGVTVADVIRATDFVLPALEIVDSRVIDWKVKIQDTIADNASSGRVVLGGSPTKLTSIDIRDIGVRLMRNGVLCEVGMTSAVLGNPVVSVAWLANKVAPFGVTLEEGHVIMPGSCTRMIPIQQGDVITAQFQQIHSVSIEII